MEGQEVKIVYRDGMPKIQSQSQSLLTKKSWWGIIFISLGNWQKYRIGHFCQFIESWEIRRGLEIRKNKDPNILKDISHINFHHLMYLSLDDNKLESIEAIIKLNCPMLQDLELCSNYIWNIQSLRKIGLRALQRLDISSNKIHSYQPLSEMQTPNLQQFHLEHIENKPTTNDITVIAKINFKNFTTATAYSSHRIKSKKVYQSLKKKRTKFIFLPKVK